MALKITHEIQYFYDQAVFLEPHILNLMPHPVQNQQVLSYECIIDPGPEGVTYNENASGFSNQLIWFETTVRKLYVESIMVVELEEYNPFSFFIHPISGVDIPMTYVKEEALLLRPYCQPMTQEWAVKAKAEELAKKAGFHTVSFLTHTSNWIHDHFQYEIRDEGDAYTSDETLKKEKGSCRDLAVLFMDFCRHMGLAARFVSGYYVNEKESLELHAWVDVYIPGAGWRGFDPTHGVGCFGKHITLTAAHDSVLCAPILGTFRGEAKATMKTNLTLAHQVD